MSPWISVHEKLPLEMECILFCNHEEVFKGYKVKCLVDDDYCFWYSVSGNEIQYVTHWMPIPELPN